ncbi:hypothetical protein [Nocardia mexicana]|uniref:Uncharacterized protein n=1 Tax=Nocardia mexicana TaxID=279262 RepID=A0A370H362_9NOCA|nr:hypothetical protein [Nocardia mexicana]RDI48523.1 hypothetical protein DFR68_108356 [Nocardia mexicana]
MTAVAWIALGTAILSFGFNIYNMVKANQDREWTRNELPRKRNAELRDELIGYLEALRTELKTAFEGIASGRDFPTEVTPEVDGAVNRLANFSEKLSDELERASLNVLTEKVRQVDIRWDLLGKEQQLIDGAAEPLKANQEAPEFEGLNKRFKEIERSIPMKQIDLRESIRDALKELQVRLEFLHFASSTGETRPGGIGLVPVRYREPK